MLASAPAISENVTTSAKVLLVFVLSFASACLAEEEVELKFVVKESEIPRALSQLTRGKRGEERNIYFLERADRGFSRKGIILRLRENPGKRDQSTVKIRGKEASGLPNAEFPLIENEKEESKLERDKVIGGKEARSFSMTVKQPEGEIADLRKGKRKLKQLFSDKQEKLLSKFAPEMDWNRIRLLGPVKTEKWKLKPDDFSYELVAELWDLPECEQKQVLEFSTKVKEKDADEAERDLRELMRRNEVLPSSSPESKTQAVLDCLLRERSQLSRSP
jgi:CYTH domain